MKQIVLCIDAGHGHSNRTPNVFDPGVVANGLREADIALAWALTGRFVLTTEFGVESFLTRRDNQTPAPLRERLSRARAAGCTHLISLHCNAGPPSASGTETYHAANRSSDWARRVHSCALASLGLRDRGVKPESASRHGRLAILRFDAPSCLLEIGFLTNASDVSAITDRDRRVAFWRLVGQSLQPKGIDRS